MDGTKRKNFYKSEVWLNLRARLMLERTNENGELICEYCGKPILKPYDCIAHHKIRLTEESVRDATIALNPENIELIHFKCHNREHQRYDGFTQRVYLVWGSPCSGKTTFVNENAYDDDLILDLDKIWQSVCKCDRYHKPNRLKKNVFGIRDFLIDQIRTRTGMWRNAYVIGTYPLKSDRERLIDLLNAEEIYIDTPKEECLKRAETEEWREFIEDFFEALTV